jgi:protein-S-isoprenylcysteine O-methyltransferase Ste14
MNNDVIRRFLQVLVILVVQLSLVFIAAGTFKLVWVFAFIACSLLILIINFIVIPLDVIKERGSKKKNVKRWDKIISGLNAVPGLGIYIVSGLDYRFEWTGPISIWIHMVGLILLLLGSMLFTWSMVSNAFFSTMVRIQDDRDHTVASEGPYKYVRHPGYVGFILMSISTPLVFGSIYALICSLMTMILMIVRTTLEDKTLKNELDGYKAYTSQVKYKLIPYVW